MTVFLILALTLAVMVEESLQWTGNVCTYTTVVYKRKRFCQAGDEDECGVWSQWTNFPEIQKRYRCCEGWQESHLASQNCSLPICNPVCQNGGTCKTPNNCTCSEGYGDNTCGTPICNPTCQNGGTCEAPNTCSCTAGYEDNTCGTPICNPTCQNGGACAAPNTCSCSEGYEGNTCGTPVCDPSCKNSGTCESPNKCKCRPLFHGNACEFEKTSAGMINDLSMLSVLGIIAAHCCRFGSSILSF